VTTEEFTVALRARLNLDVPRAHVSAIEVAVEPAPPVHDCVWSVEGGEWTKDPRGVNISAHVMARCTRHDRVYTQVLSMSYTDLALEAPNARNAMLRQALDAVRPQLDALMGTGCSGGRPAPAPRPQHRPEPKKRLTGFDYYGPPPQYEYTPARMAQLYKDLTGLGL
jgi:hypothetical protein